MNKRLVFLAAAATAAMNIFAADLPYKCDFEKAAVGSVPEDFLVLEGGFAVQEASGNKVLELPGAPLDSFGVLFGPSVADNVVVSARILGTAKGRRYPTFEVGLGNAGGFRLKVNPSKKQLELIRNDEVKAAAPFTWTPGKWTYLKLAITNAGQNKWIFNGKSWQEGQAEPTEVTLTHTETEKPPAGRASAFASPFSGTPVQFDDLAVSSLKP